MHVRKAGYILYSSAETCGFSNGLKGGSYMKPDKERILNEFCSLVEIDSESLGERRMADVLTGKLRGLGFKVHEDDAGEKIGGTAGNVYGILEGDPAKAPLLFSAHMDTVKPGIGKKAIIDPSGSIRANGSAVLGADDLNGVVEILEGIRMVIASGAPHGDIEILFPAAEEIYAKGSSHFDFSKIRSKTAYVLDMSEPVGKAANKAPSIISFEFTVNGRAAHAGFAPEKGANAIKAAARAISRLELGHAGSGTATLNIGTIQGGTALNIVPDKVAVRGEVRGFVHEDAMYQLQKAEAIFSEEAGANGCTLSVEDEVHVRAYETGTDEYVCRLFERACDSLGIPVPDGGRFRRSFGGSDNNNFALHGIKGIVLGNGMTDSHTTRENTSIDWLLLGARLVAQLISIN